MDVEGNVLEMASEPAASELCKKVKHTAYPCHEAGGFVWAYLGPRESMPEFERPAFAPTPDCQVSVVKVHVQANWAQILEGAIDSAHSSSLHSTDMPPQRVDGAKATSKAWPRPSTDKAPRLVLQETPYGFHYAAIRRPIVNSATHDYIRVSVFVAPSTVLIPPNNLYNLANVNVPMDDTNTMFYFIAWADASKPGVDVEAWRKFCGAQPGIDLDHRWRKRRNRDNFFEQDRPAMKLGDFTGIRGIPMQDMAMWETMGAIADRSRERLGASDLAIVEFRRIMVAAAQRAAQGGAVIGAGERHGPKAKLSAFEGIVPKGTDWRTLGVEPEKEEVHA
jgi:phthalate 4,5-dioxygenase oxygenase subunit